MIDALVQIAPPEPGQELYWVLGLMATAIAVVFGLYIKSKDQQLSDWKGIATAATEDLGKTTDSLRAVSDAVERHGRDTTTALTTLSGDVRKLTDTMAMVDRRLERLEGRSQPPAGER